MTARSVAGSSPTVSASTGRDTPPILIENSTAANRAVNLPEFVNIPPGGLLSIAVPAAEFYALFDHALELEREGRHEAAVAEWKKALALDPGNAKAHTNLGIALAQAGAEEAAMTHFRQAVQLNPFYAEAHNNLGVALVQAGKYGEAIGHFETVLRVNPDFAQAESNLGVALAQAGRYAEALAHWRKVLAANPDNVAVLVQTAWMLATCPEPAVRNGAEAVKLAEQAARLSGGDQGVQDLLAAAKKAEAAGKRR